jgi:cell division septum initiation protein DivIVA
MGQQISIEDAFPTFQKRCRELFEENLVLRAQVDVLERKLAEAQEENARLQPAAGEPVAGGPDLAAQPPFPDDDGQLAQAARPMER